MGVSDCAAVRCDRSPLLSEAQETLFVRVPCRRFEYLIISHVISSTYIVLVVQSSV